MVERIVDLSDLEFDDYALNDSRKGKIMKAYLKGTIGINPALTLKTCFRLFRKEGSLPEEQSIYGFGTKSAEDKFRRELQNKVGRILDIIERNAGKTRRSIRPRTVERKQLEGVVENIFTEEELEKIAFRTIRADEFNTDNRYQVSEGQECKERLGTLPDPDFLKKKPRRTGEHYGELYEQWKNPIKVPTQGTPLDEARDEEELPDKDPDGKPYQERIHEEVEPKEKKPNKYPEDEKEDPEVTEATEQRRRERDEKFSDEARRIEEARRQEEKGEREPHERKKPKYNINEEGEFEDERKQTGVPNKKTPRAAKKPKNKPDKKPKYKKPTLKAGAKFNLKDPVRQVKAGKTSLYSMIRKERERVTGGKRS